MKKRIFFVLFLLLGSLVSEAQSRIIAGEFFWGTLDPGSGNGTAFTATDGTFSDVIESLIASGQTIPNITSPIRFNVRVKDISNNWGPTFKKVIFLTTNLPNANEVKVSQGEYFFGNTDPGQGSGTQMVVFDGNWNEAIESANALNASWSLSSGMHLFNIRAKDGNNLWGPVFKKTISVQSPSSNPRLCKIQTGEFFFGITDPGQGSGTALLVLDGNWSDAIESALNSNVTWTLSNGLSLFNVRVKDESNNWGPLFKKTLSVQSTPTFRSLKVTAGEFYFGVFDPGQGSGTTILAFDGEYNDALEQAFSDDYAWSFEGTSTLFNIRFKDEANQWGPVFKKTVFKDELPTARGLNITFAEYYFGVFDPGAGTGNVIVAFDGNFDSAMEVLLRNHLTWENQSGSTLFNIRVKDETNKWGPVFKRTIFFNGANPAVNLITQGESVSRCPTFPVTLNYSGPLGFNVTWENGTTGNEVTFVPEGSGYFTVLANLGNEYLYDSIYVNVYELPPANITPSGDILVCASSNVMLTANSGTNYSYVWYYNDAVIPGETMINYLPTQIGAYKVRVTDNTTTCQQTSQATTFYLTSPIFPTGTVTTACNPNGVLLTGPVGTGNTYQWKKNGAAISGATSGTYLATTAGNYQVTVTNGQCISTSTNTTVTTAGSTVVSTISPSGTQSICDGGSVVLTASTGSGYTYQWNKDGVAIAGATSGTYTATTSGAYTVTVTATGCSLTSSATNVTLGTPVTPSVTIAANNTTVCSGTAVIFTATPTNGGATPSYQWKKNGVNISGATSATYTLTSPVNGDVVSVVMTSNNACQSTNTATSNAVTLVVNASVTPTVSITAGTNNICSGSSVQFTSAITNGGSTPVYQWKKNGVNISGATSATYTSTSLVNGDIISLQLTSNVSCATSSTATSNAVTMSVSSAVTPSVIIAANNTTVCAGTAVSFAATPTNGGTTPTYQWKKNGVNITGATSSTYTLTSPANNDAISLVMTSNAACTSTTVATSNTVTLTVTSSLTPSVGIAADATTVCSGTTVNFTATPTNGGTAPTYQWKKNGVNITGATSATYALTSPANGDVLTVVMTSNSGCVSTPTATSNAVTLVVTSVITPTVTITASGSTFCAGTSVQFTSSITNGGTAPSYQWKKNGSNINGATSATYTSDVLVNGDIITLQMTSNAVCPSATVVNSNPVTMTVTTAVTPSVSIAANSTTVCTGTAVNFTATPTNGGTTPTYQWKKNGVNITGATSATYTLTSPANGDAITVVMTSNATCASTATATSNAVTITVTTAVTPSVSIAANNTTVCSGTAVNFTATPTNGGTTPTYQWKKNGVNITGATSATYALTSPTNGDAITVVMTSNATCASTATATSNAVTITVTTAVTPSVSIAANNTTVCSGTAVNFTATPTNGGTTPTYQWKKNGVNITGATSATYTLTSPANGDAITVVMTSNATCASTATATSNAVTITVTTAVTPSVSIAANNTTVCSGTAVNFTATPTNGGTTPTYQWKKNGVNITGATSATYALTSPTNGDAITVVMTSNATCASTSTATSNAVTITVTTAVTPSVSIAANNTTVCSGTTVNFTATPTNGGTTPTYQWKKNGVNITGATSATYALTSPTNGDAITVVMTSNATCASTSTATSNAVSIIVNANVTYYADADGDGFGNPQVTQQTCIAPSGYTTNSTDCNDAAFNVNPNAVEVCDNGVDDNCNVEVDENCAISGCTDVAACNYSSAATADDGSCQYPSQTYLNCDGSCINDTDNDGVCDEIEVGGCTNPDACNYDSLATNDNGSCVLPQIEICNGLDDNCNDLIDDGLVFSNYYADADQDGYGTTLLGNFCSTPQGNVSVLDGDCNDADNTISPSASESCNTIDDNCNGQIDEGVTVSSVVSTLVTTKLYPTCSGTNLFSANLNLGYNSPVTEGDGNDLWFKLIPTFNTLRAGLSAATGDNQLELYWAQGNCLTLITTEHEVGVSNQTLFTDDLVPGNTYYVVCRNMSGPMNASAKICFNHFDGSTCDHYYSNNTGIYSNVCTAFKAVYKGNASNYVFNVNSASIGGVSQNITPWTYTTPSSSSIITRLGTLVPVNMGASPITYGLTVGVTYVLSDAAGNLNYFMANGTSPCTLTLNAETTIALRSSDRCPTLKSVASSIAPDRTVCGSSRYEWEFTQVLPTAQSAVTVLGGLNSNVLFLNNVPGMGNGKTYNVRVRPIHASGAVGAWGTAQCLKTTASGMVQEPSSENQLNQLASNSQKVLVYPNPSSDGILNLMWNNDTEGMQEVRVTDLTGKLIATDRVVVFGNQAQVSLAQLSNGVYIIQVGDQRIPWVIAK